ncbi:Hypothetical protein SMAX5B_012780 [Scophthalmus maximus]|uniref:Uncharacterized protein n=1 Tax=Scophthalmus maximus TaxID=52904 RepID=A0A2U9BWU5_SCOMX|nr:Hypothetical protein SMAX5B_012780 [Scophthalmus maximus]
MICCLSNSDYNRSLVLGQWRRLPLWDLGARYLSITNPLGTKAELYGVPVPPPTPTGKA